MTADSRVEIISPGDGPLIALGDQVIFSWRLTLQANSKSLSASNKVDKVLVENDNTWHNNMIGLQANTRAKFGLGKDGASFGDAFTLGLVIHEVKKKG